jgi:hypothetical protein
MVKIRGPSKRAIADMVECFTEEGILRHEQVRERREQGFGNIPDDDCYNYGYDGYRNRDDGDQYMVTRQF